MDVTMIDEHLENIDQRLTKLEQILPTLATKDELRAAIADAVAPLATKDELNELATREELRAATAPLATKAELREEHDRLRLDMRILIEHQDSKLDLLAEHVLSLRPKPAQ